MASDSPALATAHKLDRTGVQYSQSDIKLPVRSDGIQWIELEQLEAIEILGIRGAERVIFKGELQIPSAIQSDHHIESISDQPIEQLSPAAPTNAVSNFVAPLAHHSVVEEEYGDETISPIQKDPKLEAAIKWNIKRQHARQIVQLVFGGLLVAAVIALQVSMLSIE